MMNEQKKKMFLIKIAYWLGIGADALWAVGLLPYSYGNHATRIALQKYWEVSWTTQFGSLTFQ
jgi:hypothetical protein